ncbi:putative disease resistance protein RGA1 [Punica granatum]|uniref:Disease resistance protein RGA1 n=1 Tax=Punica granatum TaxID=22663 RepID=A0A6P8BX30_PUNGR|nr:putative disease resistance protein RGA1 [Punica granatum]
MAKKEEHEWKNQNLEKIAREIVKKCAGVPLAIKTIGRLLAFSGTTEEDWLNFKDSDLSSINQEESDIMPSLKLSYDFLPSHLKLCFAYCSLFPQDYELESRELVYLWMAQGFINKPLGSKKTLEEVGYDYFRELLSRCFFQEIRENVYGDIMSCKMHDLALLVAGENCITIDSSHAKMFPEGARHITINDPNVLNGLERERRIRSLFLTAEESTDTFSEDSTDIFGNRIPIDVLDVSCFRSLRALRIRGVRIKMISRSIGELKHLRSLDLSITGELRSLPDSISELCNLESLNLTRCWHLEGLPSGITKLVNLRQLNVSGCDHLTHMPRGIGTLTNLQRLDVFVLGEESNQNAAGLDELSGLIGLKKELTIRRLERVGSSSISSEVDASFSMEKLAHLQCLDLCWGWDANASNDKEVIEKLRPHSDVKGLRIDRYVGVRLPSWVSQLHRLVEIEIKQCGCRQLPPIDQLPSLKRIWLHGLMNLEHIELSEGGTMPQSNFFPSLEEIVLGYLPKFKGWEWERRGNRIEEEDGNSSSSSSLLMLPCFSDKVKIVIYTCGRFSYISHGEQLLRLAGWRMRNVTALLLHQHDPLLLPLGPQHDSLSLTALTSLSISKIEDADHLPVELFQSLPSLQSLEISHCPRLKALPLGAILPHLPTLETLEISYCPELDLSTDDGGGEEDEEDMPMPPNLQFTKLRKLELWYIPKLETLPWWIQHLTNLESLFIFSCENLKALPGWFPNLTSLKHLEILNCGEELRRRICCLNRYICMPQNQFLLVKLSGFFVIPAHHFGFKILYLICKCPKALRKFKGAQLVVVGAELNGQLKAPKDCFLLAKNPNGMFCKDAFSALMSSRNLYGFIKKSFLDIGSVSRILDSIMKLCPQFNWNIENQESFTNSSELEHITEATARDLNVVRPLPALPVLNSQQNRVSRLLNVLRILGVVETC